MAEVMYMQNGVYNKDADRGFRPFDPNVGIEWAIHGSTISGKDAEAPLLSEIRNSEVF
jgi:dTDP-4-dehydrorhamnose 3,5-epimerase-like enzyme